MDGYIWRKSLSVAALCLVFSTASAQEFGENSPSPSDQLVYADLGTANLIQQPGTLEQQIAALQHRLDGLEHPPLKFPASVQLLGVFQADGVAFNQDAANEQTFGEIQNGADFRRARLAAKAAIASNMNAFMQFDFGFPGRPTFTDVWVEWTELPVLGNVRVGQWKQPFSLEVVSSFRYTTFMERSSVFQPFTPFRHLGVGFYDHSEDLRSTWAASLIRTGQDQFGGSISTRGGNGLVGRVTRLAWWDEVSEGRSYLHLGGGYFLKAPPFRATRFRSIPEIFVGEQRGADIGTACFAIPGPFDGTPFFVDTLALLDVDRIHTFGAEALWVHGPLSVQSEAMAAIVDRSDNPTAALDGMYVQVGWFLTGEHRPYDRVNGAIDRVKPFEDFFLVRTDRGVEGGWGAWELALRYSHIDLNDANIRGGVMDNVTVGVNWYCNPYCKVVFNYIHSWTEPRNGVPGEANAFALRTQMDF